MLPAIHHALQRLIYEHGNIDPREVEVSFEAPTRERIDHLTRPTIYLYLYDIKENLELRQSNYETMHSNGRAMHRLAARRFDLHYMVSALTTSVEDEHLLLWRALVTLVRHAQLPGELLDEELRTLDPPPAGRMYHDEDVQRQFSIWSALNVPPHPTFTYIITVPVDLEFSGTTPLVLTRSTRYTGIQVAQSIRETHHRLGGIIRDRQGNPLPNVIVALVGSTLSSITDQAGRFTLSVPSGTIQLRVSQGAQVAQVFTLTIFDNPADNGNADQLFYHLILETGPMSASTLTD